MSELPQKRARLGELWDLAQTTSREAFVAQESQALADEEAEEEAQRQRQLASYEGQVAVILKEQAYYSRRIVFARALQQSRLRVASLI
jgi:DNA polymerase III gamma/tau subunit